VAASNQLNKVWRQSSTMAAVLGQIIANNGANAVDDGNVTTLVTQLIAALNAELAIQTPIGAIMGWGSDTPPTNWVICNGQLLDRTTFAGLFAVIGVTFGSTLSTNFRVPDFRGEFIRGKDDGRGVDPSRGMGSFQDWSTAAPKQTAPEHIVPGSGNLSLVAASNPSALGFARAAKGGESVTTVGVDSAMPTPGETDLINVCNGDAETRPRNVAINYIIRVQ
jgi:microcystin-dependent protein